MCRDVVDHVINKLAAFQNDAEAAPRWFQTLQWEDVLVGLLVSDYVDELQSHPGWASGLNYVDQVQSRWAIWT